jgi:hypothetical protein
MNLQYVNKTTKIDTHEEKYFHSILTYPLD